MVLVKAVTQKIRSKAMSLAIAKAMPIAAAMCLAIFLPLQPLCATSAEDFSFELEPLFGVRFGTLGEYVYTKDTRGKDAKLSELDWDMKPLFYGGAGALFAYKALHIDTRVRFYFPARCGSMEDSDWMNVVIPGAVNNRTNYSESENTLDHGMLFNVTASWRINTPAQMLMLCPFASFEWETLDFSAKNGEGTYADANTLASNHGQPKDYKKGELMGIDYKRDTLLTWAGLEVLVRPVERLSVTFAASVSPFMYIESVDTHYAPVGRSTAYYKDKLSEWFTAYRFSTGAAFQFNSRTSMAMNAAYTFSRKLEGDTYSRTSGTSYKLDDTSTPRADLNHIDISAGIRYKFIP